jgi:tRNA (mo5U34)-methyltransferase
MFEQELYDSLNQLGLADWAKQLRQLLPQRYSQKFHGNYDKWSEVLQALPVATPSSIDLNNAIVRVGEPGDLNENERALLKQQLREFHPWRKGPFEMFGIYIDTEWRSDWKWDRLSEHIAPLDNRNILDIGCGSGYHCWRMRGAGARFVVGIDPTVVFVMQFHAIQNYIRDPSVHVLPVGIEDLIENMNYFDSVFSMGILYHRRDYQQHLAELWNCLRDGGELVLETLVIDEQYGDLLQPKGRYAQMRNVHAIPSVSTLTAWLKQAGFSNVRCVDVTVTTMEEQRVTEWMQYQSLKDFLDPQDQTKTIEGYPAPVRAVMLANR